MPFSLILSFLVLLVFACLILLWPILIHRDSQRINRQQMNKKIYQERLLELEQEATNLTLSDKELADLKEELSSSLLQDVDLNASSSEPLERVDNKTNLVWMVVFSIFMIAGVTFYLHNGNYVPVVENAALVNKHQAELQGMIDGTIAIPQQFEEAKLPEQVRALQSMMAHQRDKARGWYMLALMYQEFRDFRDAIEAAELAHRLEPDNFDFNFAYIQLLMYANEMKFTSESYQLLNDMIAKYPNSEHLLFFKGFGAFQSGMYPIAAQSFQQLKQTLPANSEMLPMVDELILKVRAKFEQGTSTTPAKAAVGPTYVKVTVSVSPEIQAQLDSSYYLIVYAKKTGSPMPIAAVKQPVTSFPIEITLSDENAMMPSNNLSSAEQFFVTARISKHDGVMAQPDDYIRVSDVMTRTAGQMRLQLDIQ